MSIFKEIILPILGLVLFMFIIINFESEVDTLMSIIGSYIGAIIVLFLVTLGILKLLDKLFDFDIGPHSSLFLGLILASSICTAVWSWLIGNFEAIFLYSAIIVIFLFKWGEKTNTHDKELENKLTQQGERQEHKTEGKKKLPVISEPLEVKELKKKIFILLEGFHFKEADELYGENKAFLERYIDEESLDQYRAKLIQQYFGSRMEYPPDLEQAEAIGALGQNVLVSARAGSGKTATISAKVAYLCDKYGVDPSEIMVLCFNNSAAINMKENIQNLVPGFENARTFHSWASGIVMPERGSVV